MPKFAELGTVTRDELRHYDAEARQLVEDYHAAGWRSRMSNRGHVIVYAPDGKTTASVSYHSEGHIPKVARANLDRWLRKNGKRPTAPTRRKHKPLRRTLPRRSFENYPKPEPEQNETEQDNRVQEISMATRYKCLDCPEREPFATNGALALHRQRKHEGLKCKECGSTFKGPGMAQLYRTHLLEAHGIEHKSKKLHVQSVDGVYPCPWCGKPYDVLASLAGHTKTHRGQPRPDVPPPWPSNGASEEDPTKARVCPVCGEVKPHKNALNGHMRTHKAEEAKAAAGGDVEQPSANVQQPTTQALTLVATGASVDLDAWLQGQNPADLLANVLAVLAPPLVGEIERLRRERDDLAANVLALRREAEEYEARMAILREAMGL